jgi:hypothetical protein
MKIVIKGDGQIAPEDIRALETYFADAQAQAKADLASLAERVRVEPGTEVVYQVSLTRIGL